MLPPKLASRPLEFATDQEWDADVVEKVLQAQDFQEVMQAYSLSPPITRGDSAWMALQKAIAFCKTLNDHYEVGSRLAALLQSESKIQELIDSNNQEWVKKAHRLLGRSNRTADSLIDLGKQCSPYVRNFIGIYNEILTSKMTKEHRVIVLGWLASEKDQKIKKKIRTALDLKFGIFTKPCLV